MAAHTNLLSESPSFGHLKVMLTEIGLWQHGFGNIPNPVHGYSIDDEARGLIVGLRYWQLGTEPSFQKQLASICFRFLENAALTKGKNAGHYHNFCDAKGRWLDPLGSDDSFGRTLWGLGVAAAINAPFAPRDRAEALLCRSLPWADTLTPLRSRAFVMLGLAESRLDYTRLRTYADALCAEFEANAGADWQWFEDQLTYCNARLPQALFAAAQVFPQEERYRRIGAQSLDFLLERTRTKTGGYAPVGNAPMQTDGWFKRGAASPPLFDQQPVDAGALVECCALAFRVTGDPRYREAAHRAFGWYLGDNILGLPVYDSITGGVGDGLTPRGVNLNQGAESVLSVHLAWQALREL